MAKCECLTNIFLFTIEVQALYRFCIIVFFFCFVFLCLQLSEMTVDLAEEHSTATLATERLELETNERLRLENEVQHLQVRRRLLRLVALSLHNFPRI